MIQSIKAVRSTVFQFALSPPSTIPSLCGSLGSRELCSEHAGRWPPSPWSRKSGSALPQKLHCKGAVVIMPIETFMCVCVSFTRSCVSVRPLPMSHVPSLEVQWEPLFMEFISISTESKFGHFAPVFPCRTFVQNNQSQLLNSCSPLKWQLHLGTNKGTS